MDPDPVVRGERGGLIDEISSNPLPMPEPAIDEISVSAVPMPSPGLEDGFGDIGALPIPIPTEIDPIPDVYMPIGLKEEGMEDFLDQG